jgi:hypothetical protein
MTSVEEAFSHDHAKCCVGYSKCAVLPRRGGGAAALQCTITHERTFEYILILTPSDPALF